MYSNEHRGARRKNKTQFQPRKFNVIEFFKKLEPLLSIEAEVSTEDLRKAKTALNFWLKEAHTHFNDECFTSGSFVRLAHDLGKIACAHSDCKRVILDYLRNDSSFEKNLLKCSHLNLCDYDQKDLCNLLLGLAHLEIHPLADWMKGRFLQTQSYFSSFINVDFSQSLKALELLDIAPDVSWIKDWFLHCSDIMDNINITNLAHLFSAVGSLGVQVDKLWIEKCMDRLLPALTILEPDDFLDLSGSFRIKEVRENKFFIDA